jgi:O-antigen/teichoic acid export membrane protein
VRAVSPGAFAERRCPAVLKSFLKPFTGSPMRMRLATGSFWSLAGAMVSRTFALLASILVARMLGPERFGELGMINSAVGMLAAFAGFGLGATATKYVAEFRGTNSPRAGRILALSQLVSLASGALMTVCLLVSSDWLATYTMAAPHLARYLRIGSLLLLLGALNGAEVGALAGFEAFRVIAMRSLWTGLISFPLMVLGVRFWGLSGAVWALVSTMAANWLMNLVALRRVAARYGVRIELAGCTAELRMVWKYSLPAMLGGVMIGPITWACNALLVNQAGGYIQMGVFSVSAQIRMAILFVPTAISAVLLPLLSHRNPMDPDDSHSPLRRAITAAKWIAHGMAPISLLFIVASPWLTRLFGITEPGAAVSMSVLVVATYIQVCESAIVKYFEATGRMWLCLGLNVAWALVLLSGAYLFQPRTASTLSLSYLLAFAFHLILMVMVTAKSLSRNSHHVY